jgi:hypothetical protein
MAINNQPVINFFTASRKSVMEHEEVLLEWEVANAKKILLDGVSQKARGFCSVTVRQNHIFELIAENGRLSVSESIAVYLADPEIIQFVTDATIITEGLPIVTDLQIKNATSWELSVEYQDSGKKKILAKSTIENGYVVFSHRETTSPIGTCIMQLTAFNGKANVAVQNIHLWQRHLEVSINTDKRFVKALEPVRVTWNAANANKLILNPGNIEITDLPYYDFIPVGNSDIRLEVTATGDFGQRKSDAKQIFLSRVDYISTSNNGNINKPEFYLNWAATGIQDIRLQPGNIQVKESERNFAIPASGRPVTYTLFGRVYANEEVSQSLTLLPCIVHGCRLDKGSAIVGTMASISWQADEVRNIQIQFSDSPVIIDVPCNETSYQFQVFERRNRVKLIIWGDTNVEVADIPIPVYHGPEITALKLPSINIKLGVSWITSPGGANMLQYMQPPVNQNLTVNRITKKMTAKLLIFFSTPSNRMLYTIFYKSKQQGIAVVRAGRLTKAIFLQLYDKLAYVLKKIKQSKTT